MFPGFGCRVFRSSLYFFVNPFELTLNGNIQLPVFWTRRHCCCCCCKDDKARTPWLYRWQSKDIMISQCLESLPVGHSYCKICGNIRDLGSSAKSRVLNICFTMVPNSIILCSYLIMVLWLAWTGPRALVPKFSDWDTWQAVLALLTRWL